MKTFPNGYRFRDYNEYNSLLHQPYDYERKGLLKHIISSKIYNTNNNILRVILQYYEKSLVFVMRYVDRLKHFKNYLWVNR